MEARLEYEEIDRRPPRALQRGAARLRGAADQPGLARRARRRSCSRSCGTASSRARTATSSSACPNPFIEQDEEKVVEDPRLGRPRERAVPPRLRAGRGQAEAERHPRDHRPAGELDRGDRRRGQDRDALPAGDRRPLRRARRSTSTRSSASGSPRRAAPSCSRAWLRVRLVPLCENVGALAHLPDLLEAFYLALERGLGVEDLPTPEIFRTSFDRAEAVVRVFVAMSDTAEQSGKIATDAAYTLALAGREEAERRLAAHAQTARRARAVGHVPDRRRPRRLPRRLRPRAPGRHPRSSRAPTASRCRASGPTRPRRRSASPRRSAPRSRRGRGGPGPAVSAADAEALTKLLEAGVKAHTETLLRIAPLLAPFGEPRAADARAHPRDGLGQLRPLDSRRTPRSGAAARSLPDNRDLRDAWPEGVTLPRAIVYNLACTTLGLPGGDERPRRRSTGAPPSSSSGTCPGYREIIASELPYFVKEAGGARLRPEAGGDDGPPLPARRRGALGRRPHPRGARRPRPASSPWSTCGTSPRTRRAGTRRRSTRARRRARRSSSARRRASPSPRSAPSGRATAGRSSRRWSTPRTPRASSSPAS